MEMAKREKAKRKPLKARNDVGGPCNFVSVKLKVSEGVREHEIC